MEKLQLRVLIADDEAPARAGLRELLRYHENVKVVGEAYSGATAISLCRELRPDVLFLDVQMPEGDGFSILPKLQPLPAIIFVTAYDEFAIKAFEVNAVDYLLKPIVGARLSQALQRIIHAPKPPKMKGFSLEDQIILANDTEMRTTFVGELGGIEAVQNYTRVHLRDGTEMLIRRTTTEWESLLPKPQFLRLDRSLIVNLKAIKKLALDPHKPDVLNLEGFSTPIFLGNRASVRLRQALRDSDVL